MATIKRKNPVTGLWEYASTGQPGANYSDILTTKGQLIYRGDTEPQTLPIGAEGQELLSLNGVPTWGNKTTDNGFHNPDFRNPVNQRAVSGVISTGTYFLDRWIRNSGSFTIKAKSLTFANAAVLEQRIESMDWAGETVCVSVQIGGSIISGVGTFPIVVGTVSFSIAGFGMVTLGYNAEYMYILLTADAVREVMRVKFQLGTVSTLHRDPPSDYGMELLKCLPFYEDTLSYSDVESTFLGQAMTTGVLAGYVKLKYPKRIIPTCVVYDGAKTANKVSRSLTGVDSTPGQQVAITDLSKSGFLLVSGGTSNAGGFQYYYTASADL